MRHDLFLSALQRYWWVGVLVADQILKIWLIKIHPEWVFINTGVAFGVGKSWYVLVGIVLLIAFGWIYRFQPRWLWLALALAVLSNVIDRVIYGGVIDYMVLGTLKFNLADLLILSLIGLLIGHTLRHTQD